MKYLAIALIVFLSACSSKQVVIETKQSVILPDSTLYICPEPVLPTTKGLTNIGVSRLIVQLYENNSTCVSSMKALREFLNRSANLTEDKKQPEIFQPPAVYVPEKTF